MSENPYIEFGIEIPKKYHNAIKNYSRTSGGSTAEKYEVSLFERQVDFWYCAFILAVRENLTPVKGEDTYLMARGTVFSSSSFMITHIQAVFLSIHNDLEALADHRKVFNFALQMANAGIPRLIQILGDADGRPIWNLLDELYDLGEE